MNDDSNRSTRALGPKSALAAILLVGLAAACSSADPGSEDSSSDAIRWGRGGGGGWPGRDGGAQPQANQAPTGQNQGQAAGSGNATGGANAGGSGTTGANASGSGTTGANASGSGTTGANASGSGTTGAASAPAADGSSDADVAQDCVNAINELRATKSLAPFANAADQVACVDKQAITDMNAYNPTTNTGAHTSFGACHEFGQCECPRVGNDAANVKASVRNCLALMWKEGPKPAVDDGKEHGHYEAMTSTSYKKVACGVAFASDKGAYVQDYF